MKRAAWGAVALVVLAPVLAAAPIPTRLDVHAGAAGLTVRLDPAADVSAYLVVSHDDPLLGPTVDRVVPVDVPRGVAVNVTVGQLRSDVNVSVGLVDHLDLASLLTNASSLLNGSRLPELPLLGNVNLGALLPSVAPLDLYAYPYAGHGEGIRHPHVLANAAGVLGIAYLATPPDDGSISEPVVRLSRDGGHRFEDPIPLAPGETTSPSQGSNKGAFATQVAPDGAFLAVVGHDGPDRRLERVTVARLDPVTHAVARTSTPVPDGDRFPNYTPL
ncbi:MAG: hypothetical protein LC623_04740, partial [Halobacteriales archaeon]|nr:hypothetical protein [Halobacteriales archaeon]